MIRAPLGDADYWAKWIEFRKERIAKREAVLSGPSANPEYMPQYSFDLSLDVGKLILARYSRGEALNQINHEFSALIGAWELSNELNANISAERCVESLRDWDLSLRNLNHYVWCFWLVGLALVFEIPDDQWLRLVSLIGGEGEDQLLDRVIASRQRGRCIGASLLHATPYQRLLSAIDSPKERQGDLLLKFVDHWYGELKRPGPKNRQAATIEPFWYSYGDLKLVPLETGMYFGRWCIEAVAAVKVFGMDDSKCIGHDHYPAELLKPRSLDVVEQVRPAIRSRLGLIQRLFGSRR